MVRARRFLAALFVGALLPVVGCAQQAAPNPKPQAKSADEIAAVRDLGAHEVHRDLVFAERDTGPQRLDLFLPEPSPQRSPLVVYVHGGGWDAGFRYLGGASAEAGATESRTAAELVRSGYAVATVDYRLSGIAQSPAQVEDVAAGVRWLTERAADWHLDPNRVALWGSSAGGLLVSQLGAKTGEPSDPGGGLEGIRAVVNWFGPTDMSAEAEVEHPELDDYARRVVTKFLGCEPVDCPGIADAASPVRNLSGDEPPFLIQHGVDDSIVPLEQSLDFAEAMRELDLPVEVHPYEGVGHGFAPGPRTPAIVETAVDFLDEHLRS
ncbi:alpha/beta hydrolase fold domain-containing protein [Parasphingorhabdus pacifica]